MATIRNGKKALLRKALAPPTEEQKQVILNLVASAFGEKNISSLTKRWDDFHHGKGSMPTVKVFPGKPKL